MAADYGPKGNKKDDKGGGHGGKGGDGKGDGKKGDGKGGKGGDASTVKSLIRELLGSKVAGPLTGKTLRKEIKAASKLRYGPLENELDAQLRAAQATQKRNKAYYNDYLQRIRGIQQNTGDIYDDANQQLAQAQRQASQGDTALLAALNAGRQGQAQMLGATPSTGVNPLAAAQAQRGTMALNNQARVIGQGATQRSYLADQRRIGQRQKIDTLIQGQDRTRSIRQEMEDMAREKGAFKTDMLRDLREGERGFLVDLLSGPNARKLAHIQMSGSDGGSGGSSSSGDGPKNKGANRNETRRAFKDALADIKAHGVKPGSTVKEITADLIDAGYDPTIARRAARAYLRKHGNGGKGDKGHKGGKGHGGKGGGDDTPPNWQ